MTQVNTGTEDLLAEINEGVGLITLNRPEARNAMSGAMNTALAATLAGLASPRPCHPSRRGLQ